MPDTSFCLPHCAVSGECEGPRGVKSGLKELCAVSNEASYQTDETVMDEMSLPFSRLCTLITIYRH